MDITSDHITCKDLTCLLKWGWSFLIKAISFISSWYSVTALYKIESQYGRGLVCSFSRFANVWKLQILYRFQNALLHVWKVLVVTLVNWHHSQHNLFYAPLWTFGYDVKNGKLWHCFSNTSLSAIQRTEAVFFWQQCFFAVTYENICHW